MNHYIDILIKPDVEMRENWLLNKVYSKLHKALFDLQSNWIGISFPEYKIKLGCIIRIHSTDKRLEELQQTNWLGGLKGYCVVSSVQAIPVNVVYRNISRIQSNMTEAKLRRLVKRGSISNDEMKKYKAKMFQKGLDNPYLELQSTSNGQLHRRYIHFGELLEQPVLGEFDSFGLSKAATVPWF